MPTAWWLTLSCECLVEKDISDGKRNENMRKKRAKKIALNYSPVDSWLNISVILDMVRSLDSRDKCEHCGGLC